MSERAEGPTGGDVFRQIVEHGPVAIVALDPGGRVVLANAEAVRLLHGDPTGRPLEELVDHADREAAGSYREQLAGAEAASPAGVRLRLAPTGAPPLAARLVGRCLAAAPGGPLAVLALLPSPAGPPATAGGAGLDPLTGLCDRAGLFARLGEGSAPAGDGGALALVDLDHFRAVNDRLGPQAGDAVLREVARRLVGQVGEAALVARLGGDEFVLVLPQATVEVGVAVVDRALAAISQPVAVAGEAVVVTACAGVAPLGGRTAGTALRQADAARYEAKKAGRGRVVAYGPQVALWAENLWDLAATVARLEAESRTDALTGLPNVRALREALGAMADGGRTEDQPLSVLFVDLDHFGAYNKRRGDAEGDAALRLVAAAVAGTCREGDTAYRKGGEELVLLLPRTAHADALAIGERVRRAVEDLQLPHDGLPGTPFLTATVGVATARPGDRVEQVQAAAADAALRSKLVDRRNRTVSARA